MEVIQSIQTKFLQLQPFLNERTRRLWAAAEAQQLGWGATCGVCGDRKEESFSEPIEGVAAALATGFDGRHFGVGGWSGVPITILTGGHRSFGVRQGS